MTTRETHIQFTGVSKTYPDHDVHALADVSFTIGKGEFVALVGPSGCGKSSLLNLVAGIDTPSSGIVQVGDFDLKTMNDDQITTFRRTKVGFVFQFFNLLPTLTAFENVVLPLELIGKLKPPEMKAKVFAMLELVGLSDRSKFYPSQLSGGEMQRVAIARALVHNPEIVVADEPTGNLDTEAGLLILEYLTSLTRDLGNTVVMATHSTEAAEKAERILRIKDGRLQEAGT